MNCYEHTLIAKQDLSETQTKKLIDKCLEMNVLEYSKIAEKSNARFDIGRFNDWITKGVV